MIDSSRVFSVASDAHLIEFIRAAKRRLVVICPGLTTAVADSLAERLGDAGEVSITVILDSDPEVYRIRVKFCSVQG